MVCTGLYIFTVFTFLSHSAKTPSGIQSRLMGDGSDWTRAVLSWRCLQRDLMMRSDCTLSVALPGRKRKREEEEVKESGVEGSTCNGPNGAQKLGLEGERRELGPSKDHISSTEDSGRVNCVAGDKVEEDRIEGSRDRKTSTVSFRVSCRCSGALSRRFSPQVCTLEERRYLSHLFFLMENAYKNRCLVWKVSGYCVFFNEVIDEDLTLSCL